MTWYFEIVGKNHSVLETSEPIYESAGKAEMAGYRRVKERPDYLIDEISETGGTVEGGLRSVLVIGTTITAKRTAH